MFNKSKAVRHPYNLEVLFLLFLSDKAIEALRPGCDQVAGPLVVVDPQDYKSVENFLWLRYEIKNVVVAVICKTPAGA